MAISYDFSIESADPNCARHDPRILQGERLEDVEREEGKGSGWPKVRLCHCTLIKSRTRSFVKCEEVHVVAQPTGYPLLGLMWRILDFLPDCQELSSICRERG